MIYGIGTDICDVRRIRESLSRHGERFAEKVLSEAELATWRSRSERWPERGVSYLATRFSAKEAFSKAIGQPVIRLHRGLKDWFEGQGLSAHVSVTDETDYAASFVVVERTGPHAPPLRGSLPPEGAGFALGRPGGETLSSEKI